MNRAAIFILFLVVFLVGPAATAQADTATQLPFPNSSNPWIAVDPSGGHVFVSDGRGSSSIVVLNYAGAIVKTITGESGASQMALDPATHTLYVALRDATAISEINTQTLTETKRFSTAPYPDPTSLVIAGGKLWFSCFQDDGQGCIVSANLDGTGMATPIPGFFFATMLAAGGPSNKLLAIGETYESPPNIAVYDVSGSTPSLVSSARPNDATVASMTFDPSGAHLLLASGAPYYIQSLATSTLLSSAQYPTGPYPRAVATTADGKFVAGGINTNSGPDVFVYPVGSTTPVRTWQVGNDNGANLANHGLAFSPDASRLFAVAQDVATGHLAFHVLSGPTIKPAVTSTSLARSASSVRYGSTASLTVHVSGTASGKVDLYATPSGGTRQLLTSGNLSGGAATFTVKPSQDTTYSAVLEEGSAFASSTSPDLSIDVTPVLSLATRPHGKGRVRGHRVRKVLFTAGIKPARQNESLGFVVQRRAHGRWHTDVSEPFPLAANGTEHVIFYTNKRGLFRVQASYTGDSAYTASKSRWKQFRVKALR